MKIKRTSGQMARVNKTAAYFRKHAGYDKKKSYRAAWGSEKGYYNGR